MKDSVGTSLTETFVQDSIGTHHKKENVNISKTENDSPSKSKVVTVSKVMGNDIATYMEKAKNMNYSEIISLIENVFVPDKLYVFPSKDGRVFRIEW